MNSSQNLPYNLQEGHFLFVRGIQFQIDTIDLLKLKLQARNLVTDQVVELDIQKLYLNDDPDMQCIAAPTLARLNNMIEQQRRARTQLINEVDLPGHLLDRAKKIIKVVKAVDAALSEMERSAIAKGQKFRKTATLRVILETLPMPVSVANYYNYRKIYDENYGSAGLIAESIHRNTFNQTKVEPAAIHLLETLIERYYARPFPVSKIKLFNLMCSVTQRTDRMWVDPTRCPAGVPEALIEFLLNNEHPFEHILNHPDYGELLIHIKPPSRSWCYGYIRHYEESHETGDAVRVRRYGDKQAEETSAVYDTFVTNAAYPLQYVFSDHQVMDIFILDNLDKPVRVWLTVLLDAYSRSVLGFTLQPHGPSIESIQQALLHSIWPKKELTEYDITQDWTTFGIPVALSLDNAWAHQSHSLESLANMLGMNGMYTNMQLVLRKPYRARHGALIERYFRGVSEDLKQLPGAILDSSRESIRKAKENARLNTSDLRKYLTEVIVRYQHTYHSGIRMTPHERWQAGIKQSGIPHIPNLAPEVERMFWVMHPQPRTITAKGISLFNMHYVSTELVTMERVDNQGKRVEYSVRYNRQDIGRLALFRNGRWVGDVLSKELRLPDGSTQVVSEVEMEAARRQARNSDYNWLDFLNRWDEISKQRKTEQRQRARELKRPKVPEIPPTPSKSDDERMQNKAKRINNFNKLRRN